jgi:hypothetical protein
MDDYGHSEAIRAALKAAFADTNCTLTRVEVREMVDEVWQEQIDSVIRRQYLATRKGEGTK